MLESIITLFFVGLIAGIIFSMPVAGPVSIIIVSKAFEGKLRFCTRTAIGAAIVEFIYVFIVVYGITSLIEYYEPIIPYLLLIGAMFVIVVGLRITLRKLDFDTLNSEKIIRDKIENKGGMRTGIVLNLTNPSLFIGWLIASFITLSFVSSLGFNTGGLEMILNENVNSVSEIAGQEFEDLDQLNHDKTNAPVSANGQDTVSGVVLSLVFALSVGSGAALWLDQLARLIIRYRDKIKVGILNLLIQGLGIILVLIGCYLAYKAISIFIN
jgi:threonine/homoserine/homoserine lactone efflux protein